MARPSKYTPEAVQKIVQAVTAGNTRETAAAYAGITATTLYDWLKHKAEFSEAVKKAEADAEVAAVTIIRTAMPKNWQAAAWYLERKWPDRWGRKDRVTVEHQLQQEAERIAAELGIDKEQVLADAQRILARGS